MATKRTVTMQRELGGYRVLALLILVFCCAAMLSGAALAQGRGRGGGGGFAAPRGLPSLLPKQFDITGFIQEATLDTAGSICRVADPRLAGGTLKVNNVEIVVPCNTILQMPAATLTWQEVFALAPRDIGLPVDGNGIPTQSGLALADKLKLPIATPYNGPLPSFEARVQGNIVDGRYIAGLVFLSQQNLNFSQGLITAIDYENGELHIATKGVHAGIARVKINDPLGRFGLSHGAPGSGAALIEPGYDARFAVDAESPTIHATTGFPMCIPRSDPFATADDPECPQANRPRAPNCASLPAPFPAFAMPPAGRYCTNYVMPPAGGGCGANGCAPDPTRQAPFAVGDFIDTMGTLKVDAKGAYISAHTIVAHLAIYTTPGTMPAYLAIEMELQGTAALPVANLPQEATSRIKIEGFSTDPSALVDIYAVDVDPASGALRDRLLGAANPSGPPVIGRFRFIPFAGAFLPPPREFRVVTRTLCANPNQPCVFAGAPATYANGIVAGQYHAPNFEFIFPENVTLGDTPVPANFQDLAFLYCGSGPLATPTGSGNPPRVGQLDPPPWDAPMPTPPFAAGMCPAERKVGGAIVLAAAVVGAPAAVVDAAPIVTPPAAPLTAPVPAAVAAAPVVSIATAPVAAAPTATTPIATLLPSAAPLASAPVLGFAAVSASASPPLASAPAALGDARAAASSPGAAAAADPAPPPAVDALPPEVSASASAETANANQTIVLTAAASDPNTPSRPLSYTWTQLGWPAVAMTPAGRPQTSFAAPAVSTPTPLTFTVAVRNALGKTNTATVSVLVNPQAPPPAVSIAAPAAAPAGSPVAMTGVVSHGATFEWKQTAGPAVSLANPATLTPDFIAPPGPAQLSFVLTATNPAGTKASATRSIAVSADQISVGLVTWDNRQGKGRLGVVAASSAIAAGSAVAPAAIAMNATVWNDSLPSSAAGSESHPISAPLVLVKDLPGKEPVCPTRLPCFQLGQAGTIVDPKSAPARPTYLPPTTVVITSSLGGRMTVPAARIVIR